MQQHAQAAQQKVETVSATLSYTAGGAGVGGSLLMDAANYAEAWALILGCMILFLRLIYDGVRLCRYIRDKDTDKS